MTVFLGVAIGLSFAITLSLPKPAKVGSLLATLGMT